MYDEERPIVRYFNSLSTDTMIVRYAPESLRGEFMRTLMAIYCLPETTTEGNH